MSGLNSESTPEPSANQQESEGENITVATFEEFASRRDAGRMYGSDVALHRMPGQNETQRKNNLALNQARITENLTRRAQLEQEYNVLVSQGKIRPPTRIEQLQKTATGHPDNPQVQAARRLLAKKGIEW